MDADNNTDGTTPESKADTETFTKVKCKKTQKRKREQDAGDMDTEGEPVASKRPQFPPISGDKLKVTNVHCALFQRYPNVTTTTVTSTPLSTLQSSQRVFVRLRGTVF